MISNFKAYIQKYDLLLSGEKVLCCVSGGVDSMVMTSLLKECGYTIAIAHCNFSLRGEESDGDQELVERWAICNGVTLHKIKFETESYASENGISIQMAARDLRYNWFEKVAQKHGYNKIAIAHNSGDDVEGFFINLVRGSGIRGLCGMKNRSKKIIRPLMFASRREIEQYSSENGIEYRTDSSNLKTKYLRNKIRIDLLDSFREIEPNFDKTMGENLARLSENLALFDSMLNFVKKSVITESEIGAKIDFPRLLEWRECDYMLYELISPYGFLREQCSEMTSCYKSRRSGAQFESGNYRAVINRDSLVIERKDCKSHNAVTINSIEELKTLFATEIGDMENCNYKSNKDLNRAYFDFEKVKFPLIMRQWQKGDKFHPFGMKGSKLVSDLLIDLKLSLFEKEKQTVLIDREGDILWVISRRTSQKCSITSTTSSILVLSTMYEL